MLASGVSGILLVEEKILLASLLAKSHSLRPCWRHLRPMRKTVVRVAILRRAHGVGISTSRAQ